MQSARIKEGAKTCFGGCCLYPLQSLPESHNSTVKATSSAVVSSRRDFIAAMASSIQPNTRYTDHESIPSLTEVFSLLKNAYPHYLDTTLADELRAREYSHLALRNHVCLDYIGHGLFSYSQEQKFNPTAELASSSSSNPPMQRQDMPFFDISYNSVSLTSHLRYGGQETEFEIGMRKRIMEYMNVSEEDYSLVFTANQSSAFKLLGESYPFQSNQSLLTVYDYENEAVQSMVESSKKKGAHIMSAEFSWPNLRVNSKRLRKIVVNKSKQRNRGLFVFPPQSRMTGTRYSYQWMTLARENRWHVLLDASALGAKDMETLGLSLFEPEFLICSFFKVFGHNPSGFGCLLVKKSMVSVLTKSHTSMGIVSLLPSRESSEHLAFTKDETEHQTSAFALKTEKETSELQEIQEVGVFPEIVEVDAKTDSSHLLRNNNPSAIECHGLDHADDLGLILISSRARCLVNWLVNALMCLRHPHSGNGLPLVVIFGPKIKFDRGPAVAFNVYDWKGEKVDPVLVQKLADRNNISLTCGFLRHIWFSEMYDEDKDEILETRRGTKGDKKRGKDEYGISVVSASLGMLTNFEDMYRLWSFISRFLDADFVEKERWRYTALNQTTIEV